MTVNRGIILTIFHRETVENCNMTNFNKGRGCSTYLPNLSWHDLLPGISPVGYCSNRKLVPGRIELMNSECIGRKKTRIFFVRPSTFFRIVPTAPSCSGLEKNNIRRKCRFFKVSISVFPWGYIPTGRQHKNSFLFYLVSVN